MIIFSLSLFAFSTFPLPPYFFIFPHLSLFPVFFSFLFPSIPFFFSEIYSPTPFTVRRQGGPLDLPDPPSRTPLLVGPSVTTYFQMANLDERIMVIIP